MTELKPCPFCKEAKELYIGDDGVYAYYYVYCARCHTCGPSADTKLEAVGRWNAAAGKEKTEMEKSCSMSLDDLCMEAVEKWGAVAQAQKAVEELTELTLALTRWLNGKEPPAKIIDNIREEREDVEVILRQLDAIFGRSEEWQRKKYEHLRQIVEGEA